MIDATGLWFGPFVRYSQPMRPTRSTAFGPKHRRFASPRPLARAKNPEKKSPRLNYDHGHHAGNFADVIKHQAWVHALADMQARHPRVQVIDTHGGAGLYTLLPDSEAQDGILRTMQDPRDPDDRRYWELVDPLLQRATPQYPGSPLLLAQMLRPADQMLVCEIQDAPARHLQSVLAPFAARVEVHHGDGYAAATKRFNGPRLVLIDPPFENDDDWAQVIHTTTRATQSTQTRIGIWMPIKDYSEWDADIGDLRRALPATVGLRPIPHLRQPPTDPLQLNGCAIVWAGVEFA